jgi:hypothetical protein
MISQSQSYCNNTSAINISKNLVMHSKTKHIPIKYHFLREHVAKQSVKLEYITTLLEILLSLMSNTGGDYRCPR